MHQNPLITLPIIFRLTKQPDIQTLKFILQQKPNCILSSIMRIIPPMGKSSIFIQTPLQFSLVCAVTLFTFTFLVADIMTSSFSNLNNTSSTKVQWKPAALLPYYRLTVFQPLQPTCIYTNKCQRAHLTLLFEKYPFISMPLCVWYNIKICVETKIL